MLRVLKYVWKHKTLLVIGTLSMLTVIAVDLCIPFLQKMIIDDVITNKQYSIFIPIILAILGISLTKAVLGYIKEIMYDLIGAKVNEDMKTELFNHIQTFEFSYFDGMNTGELMARIGEDIENIFQTISFGLRLYIENIVYFIMSTIILFILSPILALACIVVLIPIGFMAIRLEKRLGQGYGNISDQTAEINTTAQENIAGVRLVKAFTREKHEILKFLKMNRAYYDLNMTQAKTIRTYFPTIEFFTNSSLVIMIMAGGYLVLTGDMTLGTLVAFSGYIWNLIWPLRQLGWLTDILSRNQASAKKIFDILDRKSTIFNKDNAYSPNVISGDIKFSDVTFGYNNEEVLENVTLNVPSGSTVAIMGTTGAGKSSILHLIGRYYDVEKGAVCVDGVNVKDFNLEVLRTNMSLVSQDTFLFSDTIKRNVTFGNREATEEEIREACKIACCLDFIEKFDNGFETEIGERGIGLSGGQKQRISIARALLRQAPILILDDATSALDMETEYELLSNLQKRGTTATTFIIAHRISAVKNADIIVFIEDGKILEQGKHVELVAKKGRYYEVYREQFKDFDLIESEVV